MWVTNHLIYKKFKTEMEDKQMDLETANLGTEIIMHRIEWARAELIQRRNKY